MKIAIPQHSCDATALRRDQKRRPSITDDCVGLLATLVVLTGAELSLIGSRRYVTATQMTLPVAIALTRSSCSLLRIRPHFDVIPGRVRVMPGSAIPAGTG